MKKKKVISPELQDVGVVMNTTTLNHLPGMFNVPHEVAGKPVWKADDPVDLHDELSGMFEDEDCEGDNLLMEVGEWGVLEEWGYATSSILSFLWDSIGPCTWDARIHEIRIGDDVLLAYACDEAEIPIFARFAHKDTGAVLPGLIDEVIRTNGESYGIGLFGGLPTTTENSCPGLLPESFFLDAYRTWMDKFGEWDLLLDCTRARIHEPNPMTRALNILENLPPIEQFEQHLAESRRRNEAMSESNKRYIMQLYLRVAYEEY